MLHDVTVVTRKRYECARVEGVPPEEFGISRHARSIRDCGYCFHEVVKSQADLIAQGYDPDQVNGLPSYSPLNTIEGQRRDTVDESRSAAQGDAGMNDANREILITEHYVRMDYEGKNKAALYRVTTGGTNGDILRRDNSDDDETERFSEDIVEVDEIPFAAMTPVIVTHRFFGRSIADLVMDIQRIKTALLRGALDNLYLHNNPRAEIVESLAGEDTIDDFLVSRPGGMIRVRAAGCINWQEVPDITASIYPALQYMDATREWRTGVTRQGQGVDPNALQNQVATIANQMADAAQAKTKLIARIFAETGIKDMFQLLHGIIRRNGSQAQTVRLRNKWVNVDPRDWKERNDLTVNVGLGTGNKQQQLAGTQLLIAAQEKATSLGLVSKKNVYNSLADLTKLLGHKDPEVFFVAPGQQPDPQNPDSAPIPPPPDPKQAEIQAKAQAEQAKMQGDMAHQKMKTEADIQMQQQKLQTDSTLAQQKFELERELKLIDAQIKREAHQHDLAVSAAKHQADLQAKAAELQMKSEAQQRDLAHKTQLHEMSMQTQGLKEAPGKKKAQENIVAPLIQKMAEMHQEHSQAVGQLVEASKKRPKRIKGPSGKVYSLED